MSSTTATSSTGTAAVADTKWSAWTCPNCRALTSEPRKRCRDCGTSRY